MIVTFGGRPWGFEFGAVDVVAELVGFAGGAAGVVFTIVVASMVGLATTTPPLSGR